MKRMRWTPIPVVLAALAGLCALPAHAISTVSAHAVVLLEETTPPAAPATAEAPAAATYVGAETCTTCHDTVEGPLGSTPHGSQAFGKLAPHGCETCHGPGSLHVDDPDNEALRPRVDKMAPAAVNATCQGCHDGRVQFFWRGSMHDKRGLSCITCHSIHSPKSDDAQLRRATVAEQCVTCHQQVRAETWKNSHHPIREGKITCTDCHNPHGTRPRRWSRPTRSTSSATPATPRSAGRSSGSTRRCARAA